MRRPIVRWLVLTSLALLISIPPAVAPVRAAGRQQQPGSAGTPAISLKITLPTHDLSAGSILSTSTGFTLTLTNNLAVFYSVDPPKSAITSTAMLWGRGLLGPRQQITLSVPLTRSGQGVLLTLNPTTPRAVTLDELVMVIDLVEVYMGVDVDPVAVLDAAPDLISVGAELLGATDYSAPLGALQQLLAANSLPDQARVIMGLSTSLATVLAKPALVKRLAPLLAQGLSAASHSRITQTAVKSAMTQLTPVLNGLSRLIIGGRIGAMFLDFGKLIAERISSPDDNAFAPLIPLRLTATTTPIAPSARHMQFVTIDDPRSSGTTRADGINARGDIVGTYEDSAGIHGFLLRQGVYTTIDDPRGAGGTSAFGIDAQGDIVGYYYSAGKARGFLLRQGVYTTIDDPEGTDTDVYGIDARGDIVGTYEDSAEKYHGFLLRTGP